MSLSATRMNCAPTPHRPAVARTWLYLGVCVLGSLTAGCQTPPARLAACNAAEPVLGRKGLLARQLVADTAVAAAAHPLRGGYNFVTESGADLRAVAAGSGGAAVPPCCRQNSSKSAAVSEASGPDKV